MNDELTLRDMAKLAKIKVADLAQQLGMEYGPVSTAISMDENGETPKRQSVRDRQTLIRDHLETMLKLENREGADDARPSRSYDVWASEAEANRRFPAPLGCSQEHSFGALALGSYIRLDLDQDGSPSLYRFLRIVTSAKGKQHIDVISTETKACRSLTIEELAAGKRAPR